MHGRTMRHKREISKVLIFLGPSFIGVMIFILIPFADAIRRSFCEAMSSKFVGLDNYNAVFHNNAFLLAVKNTFRFLITCIPILLFLSFILSVVLVSTKKQYEWVKTAYLIPMAIPVASVVLLWKLFFHENGLINHLFLTMGCTPIDFMNTNAAFYILIFSYVWKNCGYDMVLWIAGLMAIPESVYEAASVDGAGMIAKFRFITFPEMIPTLIMITILSIINSFKVFREAYMISGSYPHDSIYMLQHLFNNWFITLDVQKMCAAAVLLTSIILSFILFLNWITSRRDSK